MTLLVRFLRWLLETDATTAERATATRWMEAWREPRRGSPKDHALVIVAFRSDQPNIHRRMSAILALAEETDTMASVYAKPVGELAATDLDHLAHFMGWRGVRDLNITTDRSRGERDEQPD